MYISSNNEFIDLDNITVNAESINVISKEIAQKYLVFPFNINGDFVYIAMCEPANSEVINFLRFLTKKDILAFKAQEESIRNNIQTYYEKVTTQKAVEDLQIEFKGTSLNSSISKHDTYSVENAPAVKLVDSIINQAINMNASDIHIEPNDDGLLIRYRTDGALSNALPLPMDIYNTVCTRIKIIAGMDISEKRYPQDGKFQHDFGDKACDLRVSSLPTIYGEKLVIRILYKTSFFCSLENINFTSHEASLIEKMLHCSHGMILVTGPTGSGKSTTLYAMLNKINSREKNITTIEDPVEYRLKGISQVNVNTKTGITFAAGLRAILRQDPDIVMIGEIRDEETAAIAVRAAITGHLVLSTLHTNNSSSTIHRLVEMGIPRYLLADSLIAILAQRLVRRICTYCKKPVSAAEYERKILNLENDNIIYKGEGCSRCFNSGYSGRIAVNEILYINDTIREMILKGCSSDEVKQYSRKQGTLLLQDSCKRLILQGITTFEELAKISNGEC